MENIVDGVPMSSPLITRLGTTLSMTDKSHVVFLEAKDWKVRVFILPHEDANRIRWGTGWHKYIMDAIWEFNFWSYNAGLRWSTFRTPVL